MTCLTDPHTPLGEALGAVASELSDLAKLSSDLQVLVSSIFGMRDALPSEASEGLQTFDVLTQRLEELTVFLVQLGRSAPAEYQLDTALAASSVRLADLSLRLSCTPRHRTHQEELTPGEPDWF